MTVLKGKADWEDSVAMEKISAEQIPAPMLHALYARARESKREGGYLYDAKAIEIVERLDYDFEAEAGDIVMGNGAIARTILLDKMVKEYVEAHPDARIVNIACGMDTRFYRVDNGVIQWYDLDLPEVAEVRRRLFGEQERVAMISKSVTEETWTEDVESKGPVLFIVEELSMYLDKERVEKIFKDISAHFKQAEVFMEVTAPYTVKNAVQKTEEGTVHKYTWGVKNGRQLQRLAAGFKAVKSVTLMEGLKEMYPVYRFLRYAPPLRRVANKIIVLRQKQ